MTPWNLVGGALLATALSGAAASAAADEPYPEPIVTIERMKLVSGPPKVELPRATIQRSKTTHTVVITSHVARDGHVLRSRIETPSGSPHLDEAVLRSLRDLRFEPYTVDGVPTEVSVVVPFHLKAEDIPRGKF